LRAFITASYPTGPEFLPDGGLSRFADHLGVGGPHRGHPRVASLHSHQEPAAVELNEIPGAGRSELGPVEART